MKRFILCVSLAVSAQALAAVPMVRFIRVIDSRTIVVAHLQGAEESVHLSNVEIPAEDELAARAFIDQKLAGSFVYIEHGNVYRSPDALFLNRELAYGAYALPNLKMQFLGYVNPGPRAQPAPKASPARTLAPVKTPRPKAPARHTRRR